MDDSFKEQLLWGIVIVAIVLMLSHCTERSNDNKAATYTLCLEK